MRKQTCFKRIKFLKKFKKIWYSFKISKIKLLLGVKIRLWKSLSRVWLCNPMDYTVHGILQARILEWVAFPFSKGSSQPRNWTGVSCTAGGLLTNLISWETKVWRVISIRSWKPVAGLYTLDPIPVDILGSAHYPLPFCYETCSNLH